MPAPGGLRVSSCSAVCWSAEFPGAGTWGTAWGLAPTRLAWCLTSSSSATDGRARSGRSSPGFATSSATMPRGAAGFYAKSLRVDAGQVAVDRILASGLFAVLGPPRILYRVREGDTVTIYTMLPRERVAPNGRRDVIRRPYAFHLERIDGAWKLTDNLFLKIAAEPHRQGRREGRILIGRLAVLLMALALAAGCGGDDSREVRYLNSPPLVSQKQVERYPEGSPGRAVFEWMRAVAFSDATTAARLQHPPKPMTPLAARAAARAAAGAADRGQGEKAENRQGRAERQARHGGRRRDIRGSEDRQGHLRLQARADPGRLEDQEPALLARADASPVLSRLGFSGGATAPRAGLCAALLPSHADTAAECRPEALHGSQLDRPARQRRRAGRTRHSRVPDSRPRSGASVRSVSRGEGHVGDVVRDHLGPCRRSRPVSAFFASDADPVEAHVEVLEAGAVPDRGAVVVMHDRARVVEAAPAAASGPATPRRRHPGRRRTTRRSRRSRRASRAGRAPRRHRRRTPPPARSRWPRPARRAGGRRRSRAGPRRSPRS